MNRRKRSPKGTWMRLASIDTLKALMAQRGLSEAKLARYAGCSPSFISHLKTGRKRTCTKALADSLAEALQVPTSVLFVTNPSAISSRNDARKAAA